MKNRIARSRMAYIGTALALVAAVVSVGVGAGSGAAAVNAAAIPAPKGLPAFYSVPQPLPTAVGKLVKSQKVAVSRLHGTL